MIEQVKQMKLLSDLIWGEELGKIDWMCSDDWMVIEKYFLDNIITVSRDVEDYMGNKFEKNIGMLIISFPQQELVISEDMLVTNEKILSHITSWDKDKKSKVCYLSEIVIHKNFRNTNVLEELLAKFSLFLKTKQVKEFYVTAVTPAGVRVVEQFENVHKIAVKDDYRSVYKVQNTFYE